MRVLINADPYQDVEITPPPGEKKRDRAGKWPCHWVCLPDAGEPPFVTAYRCRFTLESATTVRMHVSADERYELFVDGKRIGRGSERGDAENWFFETYDVPFEAGAHVLVARVWSQGEAENAGAPYAQMTVYPGFILSPQEAEHVALMGTGVATWEAKKLDGYQFVSPIIAWGTGFNLVVHGDKFDWAFERGEGEGWQSVEKRDAGNDPQLLNDFSPLHLMKPGTLPLMLDESRQVGTVRLVAEVPADAPRLFSEFPDNTTSKIAVRDADNIGPESNAWQALIRGQGSVTVPQNTRRRVLIDLDDYYCAYPELETSGGAGSVVRVNWQESLFDEPNQMPKCNRDEVEGKYFTMIWWYKDGVGDTFLPDGGANRFFETLWWQCGRYIEVVIETKDEALTLHRFGIRETRYPLEPQSRFDASDKRLLDVAPIMVRVLQMCAHETYMDCPYYEQLQYVGDTRLQVLATFALTPDDRLARKALQMFDASRMNNGLTQSRYPSRVRQTTRGFALWWVAMVHDFALWRDDTSFVAERMNGVRAVLDGYCQFVNADGLVQIPFGPNFNFMDWVPGWKGGAAPDGGTGINGPHNWQRVLVLRQAAQLEEWMGEPEMAARWRRYAIEAEQAITTTFWDEQRGLFADDMKHEHYSEHSQCLAILAHELGGGLSETQRQRIAHGLLNDSDLARTTIYFTHYLFETYRVLGVMDHFFERMQGWFELKAQGLKTTIEMPEPTRSDCHAWGAHPLFHYFASVLGIRPAEPGFKSVHIAPQLGSLTSARGTMVHPLGEIEVDLQREASTLRGHVSLPAGASGTFVFGGITQALTGGHHSIEVAAR
jgi:hypothetical protein